MPSTLNVAVRLRWHGTKPTSTTWHTVWNVNAAATRIGSLKSHAPSVPERHQPLGTPTTRGVSVGAAASIWTWKNSPSGYHLSRR